MRLVELHLKAFGPFTDRVLAFGEDPRRIVLVHGLNEAGKSSALRAISALRFGIPMRSPDRFVHDYAQMRVGGVFLDARGERHALMRRKGTGVTLKYADFERGGVELPDAVPASVVALLTGGLSLEDYETTFGLDHAALREGGDALAHGKGEIGAALFQASAGVADVTKILDELDASARRFYLPAAQARNGRINLALGAYKAQAEQLKQAQVRPAKWESLERASRAARDALAEVQREFDAGRARQLLARELIAVAPVIASLEHANAVLAALADAPLLDEDAPAARATAQAGLSDAAADAGTSEAAAAAQRGLIGQLVLDPAVLGVGQSIAQLHAAAGAIGRLRGQLATAEADVAARADAFAAQAARIDPARPAADLLALAPSTSARARLDECIAACEEAERALAQHRAAPPSQAGAHAPDAPPMPDANLRTAVRVVLGEIAQADGPRKRLAQLPAEIRAARRALDASLAATGLPDEAAVRRVRPLLGATIDQVVAQAADLRSQRREKTQRIDDMAEAAVRQRDAIDGLLAHGHVPTHDEVRQARAHRERGWDLVRGEYIERTHPDAADFARDEPLPRAYERAVADADAVVDALASDTGRVVALESARRELAGLERDTALRRAEIDAIDAQLKAVDDAWAASLANAGIPAIPPAQLRDWQERQAKAAADADTLQARLDELDGAQALEASLAGRLRDALARLDVGAPAGEILLNTLVAIAEEALAQLDARETERVRVAGQAQELQRQAALHARRDAELAAAAGTARTAFGARLASIGLGADATIAVARARLAEFDALAAADAAHAEARARRAEHAEALSVYRDTAAGIAAALGEPAPADVGVLAGRWSARLESARAQQTKKTLAEQALQAALEALERHRAKAARHQAALARLCAAAGVDDAAALPAAEERSAAKRRASREAAAATEQLAKASRRSLDALRDEIAGRDQDALRDDDARVEQALAEIGTRLERARATDEAARRELEAIDDSDVAALAADAMARAAATVRNALPLQMRTRLAHALLGEAVRRFKERSQAPMLASASAYFAQITGGEFEGLVNDDREAAQAIAGRRAGGALVPIDAMSEGTRDQLYLALRLAALELQRERGVDLPVILDDVLMAADDERAACVFRALSRFAHGGQVIVFTHHRHLCEVARGAVGEEGVGVVELQRG
ncbi:MAG: AAA family ATPase [Burkholderiaceae bacterium]